ncbi:hypothetical protein JAAARDRAFT_538242 [Jaapia argillacea MUCL 33604]|uniref:MYND-type domain-containing protein n=1 Tax=Jaapia argillacea MUCL 33604 TaxID=933084 RepID=A0A067PJA6_9AGAM|nr:hypothetical protein JAAARDRAFT_538242 [Jaapia argillacea MUCL 33604]
MFRLVLDGWPDLWSWLEFLLEHCVLDSTIFGEQAKAAAATSFVNIIMMLSWHEDFCDPLIETPEVLSSVLCLWTRQAREKDFSLVSQTGAVLPSAAKALEPFSFSAPTLENMLHLVDGSYEQLCSIAVEHLRVCLLQKPLDISNVLADVNVLHWLMREPELVSVATFHRRSIASITTALFAVASHPLSRDPVERDAAQACIIKCASAIASCVEILDGYDLIKETLNAGCLQAILASQKWFFADPLPLDYCDPRIFLLSDVFPKYLIYRPLLMEAEASLARIVSTGLAKLLKEGDPLLKAWLKLERVIHRRILVRWKTEGVEVLYRCHNESCQTRGSKVTFLKCSGCLEVQYCTKECQRQDWKKGNHKVLCQRLQENRLSGHSAKLSSRNARFAVAVALQEFRECRDIIVQLKEPYRDTPYSSLMLRYDPVGDPVIPFFTEITQEASTDPSWQKLLQLAKATTNRVICRISLPHGATVIYLLRVISTDFLDSNPTTIDDILREDYTIWSGGEDLDEKGYCRLGKVYGVPRYSQWGKKSTGATTAVWDPVILNKLEVFAEPHLSVSSDQISGVPYHRKREFLDGWVRRTGEGGMWEVREDDKTKNEIRK